MKEIKKYGNIMIDIETLSTHTNASIIQIAAVEFNKYNGKTGKECCIKICPNEWCLNQRHVDGNTIKWWMEQDKEVVETIFNNTDNTVTLKDGLIILENFVKECDNVENDEEAVIVWGNGSTMDITILQSAYEYFNMNTPWKYWAVNDVRTIVSLNPDIKENCPFEGTKHNPIDDCKHQIKYLSQIFNSLHNEQ